MLEYALREALSTVVASDTHDLILAMALDLAGQSSLPVETTSVREFVESSFRASARQLLGPHVAEALCAEVRASMPRSFALTPIAVRAHRAEAPTRVGEALALDHAGGDGLLVRSLFPPPSRSDAADPEGRVPTIPCRDPSRRSTLPTPHSVAPLVFVVSGDPSLPSLITLALGDHAPVVHATGMRPVLAAFHVADIEPIVVLDWRRWEDLEAARQVVQEIPSNARVLLWADEHAALHLAGDLPIPPEWTRCTADAHPESVAAVVSEWVKSRAPSLRS
jgi:hypothetical protein